jgi:hypothetical protein
MADSIPRAVRISDSDLLCMTLEKQFNFENILIEMGRTNPNSTVRNLSLAVFDAVKERRRRFMTVARTRHVLEYTHLH